jgi:hypothetical protein
MSVTIAPGQPQHVPDPPARTTNSFLNAYELLNSKDLCWPVNIYAVEFKNGSRQTQENRSEIKNIGWLLKKQFRSQCPGYGYVIDLTPKWIVVPAAWTFPGPIDTPEYAVSLVKSRNAESSDREGRLIVSAILREGIKRHFKEGTSDDLGDLWQDFDAFCQYPSAITDDEYLICRKFSYAVKSLKYGIFAIQLSVSTTTVDNRTFADYYSAREVDILADMFRAQRAARVNRQNRPVKLRALRHHTEGSTELRALELDDPDSVLRDAELSRDEQYESRAGTIRCSQFGAAGCDVPLSELRLILGSQVTLEDHGETILEPDEREHWMKQMRRFVIGATTFGQQIRLADDPLELDRFDTLFIPPPAVRVRSSTGTSMISASGIRDEGALQRRARQRSEQIRRHGFLVRRPINPVLVSRPA